jgi:hypothetical protein
MMLKGRDRSAALEFYKGYKRHRTFLSMRFVDLEKRVCHE